MGSYTIGETAARSGFSASALRYYERVGVATPTARSASGYRLYDDRDLDRLAFIARAKQLGCTLDEIADLLAVRDDERCGPVQRRFHALVTAKLQAAQLQVTELAAFVAQLRAAAAQLSGEPTDGPCDDGCACTTAMLESTAPTSTPVLACTLEPDARPGRLDDWKAVLDHARARIELPDGTLRIELDGTSRLDEVVRLVGAEQHCCSFFAFAITVDERGTALEVRAPDGAAEIVTALFG